MGDAVTAAAVHHCHSTFPAAHAQPPAPPTAAGASPLNLTDAAFVERVLVETYGALTRSTNDTVTPQVEAQSAQGEVPAWVPMRAFFFVARCVLSPNRPPNPHTVRT
jgi:hypothetical protein